LAAIHNLRAERARAKNPLCSLAVVELPARADAHSAYETSAGAALSASSSISAVRAVASVLLFKIHPILARQVGEGDLQCAQLGITKLGDDPVDIGQS
jgi:hypothetical protein